MKSAIIAIAAAAFLAACNQQAAPVAPAPAPAPAAKPAAPAPAAAPKPAAPAPAAAPKPAPAPVAAPAPAAAPKPAAPAPAPVAAPAPAPAPVAAPAPAAAPGIDPVKLEKLKAELGRCETKNAFSKSQCKKRAKEDYCPGMFGKVPECS